MKHASTDLEHDLTHIPHHPAAGRQRPPGSLPTVAGGHSAGPHDCLYPSRCEGDVRKSFSHTQ